MTTARKINPASLVSWNDDKIIQYKNVDVSFAVALDEGLITPIIKSADTKGILEISAEIKNLITISLLVELIFLQIKQLKLNISLILIEVRTSEK